MLDPVSVEHWSNSRLSWVFLESWEVQSMVLMVWTWHSMKPFDLGKWGEEVM